MKTARLRWSRHVLNAAVLFAACIASTPPLAVAASSTMVSLTVEVQSVKPRPNYRESASAFKPGHLTDGISRETRMWLSPQAATWSQPIPVVIKLRVDGVSARSGEMVINVAESINLDVGVPDRIDVYSGRSESGFIHSGAWEKDPDRQVDDRSIWIRVPMAYVDRDAIVVIHATSRFLSMDELVVRERTEGEPASLDGRELLQAEDARQDSVDRLISSRNLLWNMVQAQQVMSSAETLSVRRLDPWGLRPYIQSQPGSADVIKIEMTKFERESLLLQVGASEEVEVCPSTAASGISLYEVQRMTAITGDRLLDPLVPLMTCWTLSPGEPRYLWVDIDGTDRPDGESSATLNVGNKTLRLTTVVHSTPGFTVDKHCPRVNPWTYGRERPVWNNQTRASVLLARGKTNAHFVHFNDAPALAETSAQDQSRRLQAFRSRLQELAPAKEGMIILFLRLPHFLGEDWGDVGERVGVQRLSQWLETLTQELSAAGYDKHQWALYPIDEPNARDIPPLLEFARQVKAIDPQVRLYANPIASQSAGVRIARRHIEDLRGLVDIVQPRKALVDSLGADVFRSGFEQYWLYDNPEFPPKKAPPSFYRMLAWDARQRHATGIGFWSFSHTDGNSSWTDFDDERRPSWAVTYESNDGALSSRRWEGFREGVEDACLFNYLDGMGSSLPENLRQFRDARKQWYIDVEGREAHTRRTPLAPVLKLEQ